LDSVSAIDEFVEYGMIVREMALEASDAIAANDLLGDWLTMLAASRGTCTDRIIKTLRRLFVVANIGK
jgi:hypothetical protein